MHSCYLIFCLIPGFETQLMTSAEPAYVAKGQHRAWPLSSETEYDLKSVQTISGMKCPDQLQRVCL